MPSCYLQIYENLKDVEDRDYWKEYIDFYEDYWGGPTSPYGVWFGNEYSVFQDSIADHLSLEKKDLKECLFVKDNENYLNLSKNMVDMAEYIQKLRIVLQTYETNRVEIAQ